MGEASDGRLLFATGTPIIVRETLATPFLTSGRATRFTPLRQGSSDRQSNARAPNLHHSATPIASNCGYSWTVELLKTNGG